MKSLHRKIYILFLFTVPVLAFSQADSTGLRLIESRKFSAAQSFFEKEVRKNKKDADAHYYLSVALMRQQQYDDAEDAIDNAIDLNSTAASYHLLRGQILGLKARDANVISQGFLAPKIKNAFLRASELDPGSIEARQALFNYYIIAPGIMGGSQEKALEQANTIVSLDPVRGHLLLSNFYLRAKSDTALAEQHIRKAIDAAPNSGAGYKQLGYLLMNRNRFAEAYGQMQKYIDREPDNADAYDSYADVLKAEKKYDQAIEKYHVALSVDKTYSASVYSIAECYELKGMKTKAKETYQWYVTLEPQGRRSVAAQKKIKEL